MDVLSAANPAVTFLRTVRCQNAKELIEEYATFLLRESGTYDLPVQLERVRQYLALPVHRQELGSDQRGFTTPDLRIYLNATDWRTVQKFTLAHELVEVLFLALKAGYADDWLSDRAFTTLCDNKERFCDSGAADLIMPRPLFTDLVLQRRLSFDWAQDVAARCEVSLTATLWRIIESGAVPVLLVFWRHKHSPTEFVPSAVGQGNLFGPPEAMDPPKKMRVERVFSPPDFPYIPPDKSVPLQTSIHRAFEEGTILAGYEDLDLVGLRGRYFVESRPFNANGERCVMSLIFLDGEPSH